MSIGTQLLSWVNRFSGRGGALADRTGSQFASPTGSIVPGTPVAVTVDAAMQLSTIWACIERRANIIASLPIDVMLTPARGPRVDAVGTRLYSLLRETPNPRMTPFQFWRAMMVNHDARGNAYARIVRDGEGGEAVSMWPMAADQVEQIILADGTVWYTHTLEGVVYVYPSDDVLHLKNLGNGTSGFAKLDFMGASVAEAAAQVNAAAKTFGSGGKPTAILMTERTLKPDQRIALQERFAEMAAGSASRLFVLEADFKYQQLSATPEQQQLLESRRHSVEELCRWMDVPPVLVYHSSQTAWGSGIEQIIEGFHKFTVGPLCVSIEQAIRKTVLTPAQRARMAVEFNLDSLLRGSPKARFELWATAVQNGLLTRDEVRLVENWPAMGGGAAILTAQTNLSPVDMLGQTPPAGATGTQPAVAQ